MVGGGGLGTVQDPWSAHTLDLFAELDPSVCGVPVAEGALAVHLWGLLLPREHQPGEQGALLMLRDAYPGVLQYLDSR